MNKNLTKTTVELIADAESLSLSKFAVLIGCNPQNMYDIKSGKAKGVSNSIADKIVSTFPQYSRSWILTGEGDMLVHPIQQSINGDGNTQVAGNNNQVNNSPATIDKAIDEIAAQRRVVEKSQEQIDRLLSIIENMNRNGN